MKWSSVFTIFPLYSSVFTTFAFSKRQGVISSAPDTVCLICMIGSYPGFTKHLSWLFSRIVGVPSHTLLVHYHSFVISCRFYYFTLVFLYVICSFVPQASLCSFSVICYLYICVKLFHKIIASYTISVITMLENT